MDFSLTEEHLMTERMVQNFTQKEILPVIKEYDRKQEPIPFALQRLGELGILGICIPVRYGGQGMDFISLGLACEGLEAADTSLRVAMSVHVGLCALTLLQWGSEEQKQKYLVPLASGQKLGCGVFTEPGMGSDVASMSTSAKRDGDFYILNGEKMWISLASKADYAMVTVRTNPGAARPSNRLSTFIVDLNMPGITRGDIHGKLGVRAGSTGWINFQDARVPVENRIGEEGEGFKITMSAFDHGRYTVASGAAGIVRAALEASVRYAKERTSFGKPIAEHQLIQEKIARMSQDYEIARLLYLRAGWLKNQGVRNTLETSFAKKFATEASFRAADDAIQIHGAYGYSDEYDVERYLRNARGAIIYEGSSEIQTLIQAGYALGERQEKPLRCEMPAYDPDYWQS
ncbi:MAG: butyryl-CoA dehydrogenase [Chloroflexi bacterium GWB2_49_20]|nr:MAG: butyryl-CoA dehydrogenase [Chloroflexi bacterium GWB2_49_20]OGN77378.1 MAG: butyryl-CoA dehydrogenase [Chloroflexi bacterium GWC2_49_37]OGN85779.1 MAG: butyryl-CoA dehydrogenase [Chloroflexi bacterium GWD2_49_16]HBG73940.1 butyryl-CoA dehydrogenase [Anaerolineae bacterium]HCC78284.1 butyryl-CoA dehydrogenase [Anaerolineae bacterium]